MDIYLAHSHSWLRSQLIEHGAPGLADVNLVDAREDADIIIYPKPPWADSRAHDLLREFRPRELRRTYVYSQADEPVPWAPGVYSSLPLARASNAFRGGFYIAHHHYEDGGLASDLEAAHDIEPDLLWSFVGTVSNHPTRMRLTQIQDERGFVRNTQEWSDRVRWGWSDQYRAEGRKTFADFASILGRSSFVICPRGRGASSIRLFEALQVSRCPVIISDDWLPPSFVDWDSCSVRIPEDGISDLPAILREREREAEALGRKGRLVWERLFSPEHRLETLIRSCLNIADNDPRRSAVLARAAFHRDTVRRGIRMARRQLKYPGRHRVATE